MLSQCSGVWVLWAEPAPVGSGRSSQNPCNKINLRTFSFFFVLQFVFKKWAVSKSTEICSQGGG